MALPQDMQPSKAELMKAIEVMSIAHAMVEASGPQGKPSGHLYAEMMAVFADVQTYESMISQMITLKLLTRKGHLLTALSVKSSVSPA